LANVISIGENAFASCSKLTDCYCYASTVPTTSTIAFTNQYIANATLHIPAELIEDYNYSDPWYNFGMIVALTEEELGVSGVAAGENQSDGKFIENGKLVIIRNGVKYNSAGQMM
nr:hypothetical protein [Bacteroidaceae bacterium]